MDKSNLHSITIQRKKQTRTPIIFFFLVWFWFWLIIIYKIIHHFFTCFFFGVILFLKTACLVNSMILPNSVFSFHSFIHYIPSIHKIRCVCGWQIKCCPCKNKKKSNYNRRSTLNS